MNITVKITHAIHISRRKKLNSPHMTYENVFADHLSQLGCLRNWGRDVDLINTSNNHKMSLI